MSVRILVGSGAAMAPAYLSYSAAMVSKTARKMAAMKLDVVSIGLNATNRIVVLFIS